MKAEHRQTADLIRRDGLIRRREHPELSNQIGWLARSGRLVPVLQDCYVAGSRRKEPDILMLAAGRARPDPPDDAGADCCGSRRDEWGEAIDGVLRRRAATLAGLRQALELSADRRGNRRRRLAGDPPDLDDAG